MWCVLNVLGDILICSMSDTAVTARKLWGFTAIWDLFQEQFISIHPCLCQRPEISVGYDTYFFSASPTCLGFASRNYPMPQAVA